MPRRRVGAFGWLLLLVLLAGGRRAAAQYYTWGADAPQRWSTVATPDVRMIFPDTASRIALRTLDCIRTVRPDIGFGFRHGPMRIPFVLHAENFRSNGLVMYLPERVEFLTSPAVRGYSMPWYKQLVAHEYRHAVQYNNLDRGVIRVLSYLLGQQGSTVGLLFMPLWAIEGDAVMSETAMSSFGRGRQPSFSLGYRALAGTPWRERRNIDKWFCGSYRDYVPDHYELGYQLCSYAWERYGEVVWDKVARFGVRNPYLIVPTYFALRKYYKTDTGGLFHDTFDELERLWAETPPPADSPRTLAALPDGNYTTWRWPLPLGDTTIVAVHADYDRTERFVTVDPATGRERASVFVGSLSSRPSTDGRQLWWTEYRRSKLFDQRVASQLCRMEIDGGRPRRVRGVRNALYPEPVPEGLAWVAYTPDGRYTVCRGRPDSPSTVRRLPLPRDKEIHGLAWDDGTGALYALVTDDEGMWIARVEEELVPVTAGAYITLSDLRAGGGRLYFGSIASGRDEAHCLDLATGREYRLTSSAYGSFSPAPAAEGTLVTTYDRRGYRLAVQPAVDSVGEPVAPSRLPRETVNPPRRPWPVVNLDTVRFETADSLCETSSGRVRRYRKGLHLVNVHSWMPLSMDPFRLVDEHAVDLNVGVTLLSQNLLSSTEAFASYGWNRREGSLFRLGVRYFGLGVQLRFDADWGGNQLFYSLATYNAEEDRYEYQSRPSPDRYYSVGLSATLPLRFDCGRHVRVLSLSAGWNYSNGMVADLDKIEWKEGGIQNIQHIGFREGLHKLAAGVGFSDQVRLAHRDFLPRWGYLVRADYTVDPSDDNFSDLLSFYVQGYLPGAAPHHSLRLAAAYQTSIGGYRYPTGYAPLSYRSSRLIPRGFSSSQILSNDYTAFSLDYQLPLCYPDGGIGSVLYFKRIRLNVGGSYAFFFDYAARGRLRREIWSAGGDLIVDLNLFRQPASATSSVKLSLYRPSSGGVWWTVGVGLPF